MCKRNVDLEIAHSYSYSTEAKHKTGFCLVPAISTHPRRFAFRTKPCKYFENNCCRYGIKCRFIHDYEKKSQLQKIKEQMEKLNFGIESKMEGFQKINSGIDKKFEEFQIACINQSAMLTKEMKSGMDKKFEEFQKTITTQSAIIQKQTSEIEKLNKSLLELLNFHKHYKPVDGDSFNATALKSNNSLANMVIDDTANSKTNDIGTLKFQNKNPSTQTKSEQKEEFVGAQACIEPVYTAMNVSNVAQNVKSSSKSSQPKHRQSATLKIGDRVKGYCPILGLTVIGRLTKVSKNTVHIVGDGADHFDKFQRQHTQLLDNDEK